MCPKCHLISFSGILRENFNLFTKKNFILNENYWSSEGLTWQADNRTDRPFNGKNALRLGRLWGRALRLEQDRGPSAAVRMLCLKEKRTEFSIRSDGI